MPCRAVPGRVADSLFRPHPEQRARASREPQIIVRQMRHELTRFRCIVSNPDKFHVRITAGPNGTAEGVHVVAASSEPQG